MKVRRFPVKEPLIKLTPNTKLIGKVTVLNSGMMSDLMVHEVFDYNSAFKKAADVSKSYKKPGE